jgi:hypothetical protein
MSDVTLTVSNDAPVVEFSVMSGTENVQFSVQQAPDVVQVVVGPQIGLQGPVGPAGAQGIQGPAGPAGPQNLVVAATQPTFGTGQAGLWVQTGLGVDGSGFTLWIEDGQ